MTDWTQHANVEAAWLFGEGAGTSVDNAEGTASRDGTFKSDGEPAWVGSVTGTNAPSYATDCVEFAGDDDYIRCGTDDILTENGALTIVSWIFPDVDHLGAILSRRVVAGGGNVRFAVHNTVSKSLRFSVAGATQLERISDADSITTEVWNHAAATWDGSTTAANVTIYANGIEVGYNTTTNGASIINNAGGTTAIGYTHDNFNFFNGKITETASFGVILDSTDINDIYDNGLKQDSASASASPTLERITLRTGDPVFLQQEGFRWRADDAGEAAGSWIAAQDANITRARNVNTRLRVLINGHGDPGSEQYKLEYRKVGDTTWKPVPTE